MWLKPKEYWNLWWVHRAIHGARRSPMGLVVETQVGGVPLSRGGLEAVRVLLDNNLKDGSWIPRSWLI